MSTDFFALPLRIAVKPPNWIVAIITINHLGALGILFIAFIPPGVKWLLSLLVIVSLLYFLGFFVFRRMPDSIVEVILDQKDEWQLCKRDGSVSYAILLPASFVHPALVVLTFKQGYRRRYVMIGPAGLSENIFRRLRVRLKFSRSEGIS